MLRQHAPQQLRLINLLMEMISTWATRPSGASGHKGIPQGNDVSSWLGTLYLVQMDIELLKLQRRGLIEFIRYVDDIKVFAKDYRTARRVVLLINQLLRRMHLNMQTSKTDIFPGRRYPEASRSMASREGYRNSRRSSRGRRQDHAAPEADTISKVQPVFDAHLSKASTLQKGDIRLLKRVLTLLQKGGVADGRRVLPEPHLGSASCIDGQDYKVARPLDGPRRRAPEC